MNQAEIKIIELVKQEAVHKLKMQGIDAKVSVYVRIAEKSPEDLTVVIEQALGLRKGAICEKTRKTEHVEARHICSMFMRELFPQIPLSVIARYYGLKDHTTIL